MANSKRRRLEDPAEIASSSTNPRNINELQSPTTPDPMVGVSGSKNQEGDQLFGNDFKQVHLDHVKLKPTIAKFISGLGALASSIQNIGWYGASKEEIIDIITNGFIRSSYRHGVQFSAYDYPLDCLQTAIQDKDGPRHIDLPSDISEFLLIQVSEVAGNNVLIELMKSLCSAQRI
ncbi:hypothetical protein RDI58_001300 [Solanum bulbocastanum]|uniref:Uncharacterized protein n=1 Tax=Solanum bulbocastanum TaxID=147425 RepID=A0AAN8UCF9_SOLBU